MSKRYSNGAPRRNVLALAIGLGFAGFAGIAFGQATTGGISGQAPAGDTVVAQSATGVSRSTTVDAAGNFTITQLPLGTYTVTLQNNGQTVDTRSNVMLSVGGRTPVSFATAASAANAQNLSGLTVTANALPAIDVSGVDSRTVITAQQLAKLPLARSAEAIALLAPGANEGSGYFVGPNGNTLVSFGGSSVVENAYYINGFNTTDPLSGFGGITLPYGAIDQEEVLTGGYDAAYGRSDGGVLNLVGKRGTNEWHFGAQVQWTPKFGRSSPNDFYYPANTGSPREGQIYQHRADNNSWNALVDGYVGGPLIKDKLYLFAAAEANRTEGTANGSIGAPFNAHRRYTDPKHYIKVDWNINDSNILEYTNVGSEHTYEAALYDWDYSNGTGSEGAFNSYDTSTKLSAKDNIVKYTGYITDDLTISALYGKQKLTYYNETPGYDPSFANVLGAGNQNPAITGGGAFTSPNAITTFTNPAHTSTNTNLRFDVTYRLFDHTVTAGIDNQDTHDVGDGTSTSGPGYAWEYDKHDPTTPISDQPFVDATGNYPGGQTGYYVDQYRFETAASVRVKQRAQYIQDAWQINDRFLLKVGVRNDQFTNYNPDGVAFLRLTKPQLAPRLGFSWDVLGDSTFKVYGNAGRYYLAMPASVALRAAGGSLYTRTYYTYTGIDPNGVPTGLTPINTANGPGGAVSANNEYGQQPDPHSVAARSIGSEHQDEFVLGFDKQFNTAWTYGAKAIVRKLREGLDDICDPDTILAKATALGYDTSTITNVNGCYLSNPGRTNVYALPNTSGGYYNVPVTADEFHMADFKRSYYAMNLYLEHVFDGKWQARVDYTFSRSYGNSEGQVRSDIGQSDVSATVDWDYGVFSDYANGYLANDRKHQLKVYGSYQVTPEWLLGAIMKVSSGTPRSCLGYYGAGQTNPTGYGPYYHYCDGVPSRPGDAGRNPWNETLDLNAEYRPAFADHKLAFSVYVFNVLNQQRITQTYPIYGQAGSVTASFHRPVTAETPRYVRFGVTYDF